MRGADPGYRHRRRAYRAVDALDAAAQQGHWPDWTVFHGAGAHPGRLARGVARLALGGINRLRGGLVACGDGEAAIGPLSACNFSLLSVFLSLAGELRRLRSAGFVVEAIFTPEGLRLPVHEPGRGHAPWHHFVARNADSAMMTEAGNHVTGSPLSRG